MQYKRPAKDFSLDSGEREALLAAYYREYAEWAERDPTALNRKVSRSAFEDLLDRIGGLLLAEAELAASNPGPVRDFLADNPLPRSLDGKLPDQFRAFCLMLNALKQWVNAEQAATDRYLLGGRARVECQDAAEFCIASGEPLEAASELHHPVRDGRPPIPLNKAAHARLEGQLSSGDGDPIRADLLALKRQANRSWVHLRRGCQDLLGQDVSHSTPAVGASSRTFARKAAAATGMSFEQLLGWLDDNELGRS